MYARRIKFENQRWNCIVQHRDKYLSSSSSCRQYSIRQLSGCASIQNPRGGSSSLVDKYLSNSLGNPLPKRCTWLLGRSNILNSTSCSMLRFYSSEGDERSASEDKDVVDTTDKNAKNSDAHTQFLEQDQLEWLANEKLVIENKNKESPYLARRERFRNQFLRKIVPWEKITISPDTFPYYIRKRTIDLLVECTASHMKKNKYTDCGGHLKSSSGRILLQSIPGMELYRELLVRALARELQVPLLVLDSSVLLTSYDSSDDCSSKNKSDEYSDSDEDSDEEERKSSSEDSKSSKASSNDKTATLPLKKGDLVKYKGQPILIEADKRILSGGQRGEVYEVNGDKVAFILDSDKATKKGDLDKKSAEPSTTSSFCWIDVKDIEHDLDTESQDWYVSVEVLCEVLKSQQPVIVYFPDPSLLLSESVSKSKHDELILKFQEMFDKLSGPIVFICGQNKLGYYEKLKLPLPLRELIDRLKATDQSANDNICKLFTNVLSLSPPKEEDLLKIFIKQIEEDERIVLSRNNFYEIHRVLVKHGLSCMDLLHVNTDSLKLTGQKAEDLVGWAKNHYLSSCSNLPIKGDLLHLPRDSFELAVSRLKEQEQEQETGWDNHSHDIQKLATNCHEKTFISAVVPPNEISVRFNDVGALEDVKKALNELVILPMQRPELFSHGNLLRPCKGMLLFGPPGTGKTLIAKALAKEAGANFINVTNSHLTSKWYGEDEKLVAALFSFASKLAPVVIFVDEIDSVLGARGGLSEHEATRKLKNEFMASWDGLRSKENQRIIVIGATNRPFDLDEAVIRRLPRRIYVDLPDTENRLKILKILLAQENLVTEFSFEQLANDTDGYSGSDLKNLCIAAAYRPVQELLEEESKNNTKFEGQLRPLCLDDFIYSKTKVAPSVAYDSANMSALRKWNDQYGEGGSR